jgi:hypothetical protein
MKKYLLLIILPAIFLFGCKAIKPVADKRTEAAQSKVQGTEPSPAEINFADQITWLLGYFNPSQLAHEPHSSWYIKGYDDYQFNTEAINKLLELNKDGITIKIVMGTWCPDSRREVPRFMRVLDLWQFPVSMVTFIGVDNAKLSPVGEYNSLAIQWVPTFIIYRNNIELGRIIENPKTSLEQDMVNILTRNQ